MIFLVRGIVNPFKFSFPNFAITDIQVSLIFSLLWKAVGICELNSLNVIGVTCDGA